MILGLAVGLMLAGCVDRPPPPAPQHAETGPAALPPPTALVPMPLAPVGGTPAGGFAAPVFHRYYPPSLTPGML